LNFGGGRLVLFSQNNQWWVKGWGKLKKKQTQTKKKHHNTLQHHVRKGIYDKKGFELFKKFGEFRKTERGGARKNFKALPRVILLHQDRGTSRRWKGVQNDRVTVGGVWDYY